MVGSMCASADGSAGCQERGASQSGGNAEAWKRGHQGAAASLEGGLGLTFQCTKKRERPRTTRSIWSNIMRSFAAPYRMLLASAFVLCCVSISGAFHDQLCDQALLKIYHEADEFAWSLEWIKRDCEVVAALTGTVGWRRLYRESTCPARGVLQAPGSRVHAAPAAWQGACCGAGCAGVYVSLYVCVCASLPAILVRKRATGQITKHT
eukprot:1156856-Pelagomonas_calceolata.AAC.1